MEIVEVDDAIAGNVILVDCQLQFRDQPAASPCQCRHHDCPNPVSDRIPGEDQNGPVAPWGCGKPQFTPSHQPSRSTLRTAPNRRCWPTTFLQG
jgi:hypothetical protein